MGICDVVAIVVAVLKAFGIVSVSWGAIIGWWLVYVISSAIFGAIVELLKD